MRRACEHHVCTHGRTKPHPIPNHPWPDDTCPGPKVPRVCLSCVDVPSGTKDTAISDAIVGRCVGCFHDFRQGACGGCGAIPGRASSVDAAVSRHPAGRQRELSRETEMWTRPNTSSGRFDELKRRGISFRGAQR